MIPIPTLDLSFAAAWRPALTGSMHSEDAQAWYHAALPHLPLNGQVVEVGVGWGRSLVFAAELLAALGTRCTLYGFDTFLGPDWPEGRRASVPTYFSAISHIWNNSSPVELARVSVNRLSSLAAAQLFCRESLDLVFIDGDHSALAVAEDIAAWGPVVKRGGWLSGHDYCRDWPGVIAAVDALIGGRVRVFGTVWVVEM